MHLNLDAACGLVGQALGDTPYLVGSALQTDKWRDVDIRVIMDDEKYEALFGTNGPSLSNAFCVLLHTAVSEWLSKQSGLPVDFQVQKRSKVRKEDWDRPRMALGWYSTVAKDAPPWHGRED